MSEITVTQELEKKWKEEIVRKESIEQELKRVNEVFYCKDCNKQYLNVQDWTNHMQSYDHHHRVRMEEMRVRERNRNNAGLADRDQRRQEKDFVRLNELAQARLEESTVKVHVKPTKAAAILEKGEFSFGAKLKKAGGISRFRGKPLGTIKKSALNAFAEADDDDEAEAEAAATHRKKRPMALKQQ